jgi:nucleoredoxin
VHSPFVILQVKISSIEASPVALYFSASWCPPCRGLHSQAYRSIQRTGHSGKELRGRLVSGDQDEEAFNEYLGKMPWLAVPFSDSEGSKALDGRFKVSGTPRLVILDSKTGEVYTEDGVRLVRKYGIEAYPFILERINELKEQEKAAKDNQTIKSVLGTSTRDYLITNKGDKVTGSCDFYITSN